MRQTFITLGMFTLFCLTAACATERRTFTITEPFGLSWGPDRVNYPVEFPRGQVAATGVALADSARNPVAVQLSDITRWPDGTVKSATLSFMATLQPDEQGQWVLTGGLQPVQQPPTDLHVVAGAQSIELTTAKTGIRLAGGEATYAAGVSVEQLPAPIQGLRLSNGQWIGKGWWQADRACLGYSAKVVENGPVFARVALKYLFTDATSYNATIELSAGQDLAVVSEEFNMSQGESYEMPEQPGTKPGDKFRYVLPHFAPPDRGMLWDWWGSTHGRVPSPNCYNFSFYNGLQPDRCEWYGRMWHVLPNEQGTHDTAIPYDKDGRLISVNAFLQWSDDESLYFGAYNAQNSADEVAIVGLRPGQWVNPDLEPHPIKTLNQWTATNNMWIERRQAHDLYLRVPTCLGKRVYGIGVLRRKPIKLADGKAGVTSEIMLRHVRFGRERLDEVKDWVLDYPETAKYPRLFVEPGDMARLQARAKGNGMTEDGFNYYLGYLLKGDAATGKALIDRVTNTLHEDCQRIATEDWDHNSYASSRQWHALAADVALGVPEITPEQATRLRRYIAATAYNCMSSDYVPPREAGYCWGSANMMEQLRFRGGTLMACLVPNLPQSKIWRASLAKFLVANTAEKINSSGSTLEIGGYGVMGIEFATIPYLALAHSDNTLDFSALLPRIRAAARNRLSYLMPYDLRGGFRAPATIGDSPYVAEYSLPMLAAALEISDPHIARQLIWGIKQGGLKMNGWQPLPGLLFDPNATAEVPDLHSEQFTGSGFVLRNGFPRNDETYVNLNAGAFAIGHGHSDRGCFILYAKGAPLMIDFGSQYEPSIREAYFHNGGLIFNPDETVRPCPGRDQPGCFFTGKVWSDHTIEPFTCLEPGWDPEANNLDDALGKADAFTTLPSADYAVMERHINYLNRVPYMFEETHKQFMASGPADDVWMKQPFTWTRRVMFVKTADPLGPNYVVLRDDLSGNTELKPALNFWCLADKLEVNGAQATYTGQYGVDLDCYVAEPVTFTPLTHRAGHTNGREFGDYYQKTFGKPFEEYQRLLQIPQQTGGGFFVALVPRKHADAAPTFASMLDGKAIRVTFPGRTDTVVLLNNPSETTVEGLKLNGTAFVVTREGTKLTITMLAPGTVTQGARILLKIPGTVLVK